LINLKGTSEIAAIARVPRGDEDEAGEEIDMNGDQEPSEDENNADSAEPSTEE
jgi:hypothetical protein